MWLPVTHDDGRRDRLRHRALHVAAPWSCQRPPRRPAPPAPIGGAPPITSDPPFHHHRPPPAAAAVRAEADRAVGAGDPRGCATSCSTRSATSLAGETGHRRGGAVRPAHPGQRHRPDARLPRSRTPTCSASSSTTRSSGIDRRARGARRRRSSASTTTSTPRSQDHIEQPARRPHRRTCSTSRSTASRSAPSTCAASIVLLLIAGIDTTWSAIGSSLWHLAQHPDDLAAPAPTSPS